MKVQLLKTCLSKHHVKIHEDNRSEKNQPHLQPFIAFNGQD